MTQSTEKLNRSREFSQLCTPSLLPLEMCKLGARIYDGDQSKVISELKKLARRNRHNPQAAKAFLRGAAFSREQIRLIEAPY